MNTSSAVDYGYPLHGASLYSCMHVLHVSCKLVHAFLNLVPLTHVHAHTALQEWIFRIEGFKPYGWYLTLVQFALYSLFGVIEMAITGDWARRLVDLAILKLK